jgi:hypothetical protein
MLEKIYPWRGLRVDIINVIGHTLYLAESKGLTMMINCILKVGWNINISSHIYAIFTQYCTLVYPISALFEAYIPHLKHRRNNLV